jgi:UPF0755 protein
MNIRKASKKFTNGLVKLAIYAVFVIILIALTVTAFNYGKKVFSEDGVAEAPGQDIYITIPDDPSASEVATLLESYGLIEDAFIFRIQSFIFELDTDESPIIPGDYKFNTSQNAEEIIDMLKTGPETETEEEDEE